MKDPTLLVAEPGGKRARPPRPEELIVVAAGYLLGLTISQLRHAGESDADIRERVESILAGLPPA